MDLNTCIVNTLHVQIVIFLCQKLNRACFPLTAHLALAQLAWVLAPLMEVDEERVIPDGSISFADGCVQALSSNPNAWFMRQVEGLLKLMAIL